MWGPSWEKVVRSTVRGMLEADVTAANKFVADLSREFGLSAGDAEKVFRVFKKFKVVKLDRLNVTYNVKHGAFWGKGPVARALKVANGEES